MSRCQAAILAPVPPTGRYLLFSIRQPQALRATLAALATQVDGLNVLIGLGAELTQALGVEVPGLHPMAAIEQPDLRVPSTAAALCCWLRGGDRGELVLLTRQLEQVLSPALGLHKLIDSFRYGQGPNGHGRDLTGFEDGTENPQGQAASAAAILAGAEPGLDGSSFMVVQQWLHDLDAFDALSERAQSQLMGRQRDDNAELADAPACAHVKRTEQESFAPPAFVLRRSMPWSLGRSAGLVFVAFGHSFDAFERQMRRMAGLDDGVADALFQISRPLTGAFFWCPPMRDGRLDLRWLDL